MITFKELTPENIAWFRTRKDFRRSDDALTVKGILKLADIAFSDRYNFLFQPKKIQDEILKLLRTSEMGKSYAHLLEEKRERMIVCHCSL